MNYIPTEEDEAFLSDVESGVIGLENPQVEYHYPTAVEQLQAIQGDWPDRDNDPKDGENKQGW